MKTAAQWMLYCVLGLWGFASLVILGAPQDPEAPMNDGLFAITKVAALASIMAIFKISGICYRKGLLPKVKKEE